MFKTNERCHVHLAKQFLVFLKILFSKQFLILQQRSPQFFLNPNPSSSLINISSNFFNWIDVVFHPNFSRIWTQRTPYSKKNLGSLNPTVYFYKYSKNMRYSYQAYIIYDTNFIIHTHLYTSKKILSFSFCEYKLPYIFLHIVI